MAGMLLSPPVAQTLAEKLSGEKMPDASQVQGMINVLNAISNATEPHSIRFRAIGSQLGVDVAYVIVTHSQFLRKWRTLDLSTIPLFEEEKGPGRDRIARKILEDNGLPAKVKLTNYYKKIQGLRIAGMLLSPAVAQTLAERLSGRKLEDASEAQGMASVLGIISDATEPHSIRFRAIGSQLGVDVAYVIVTHSQLLR
ncbi:hypothetical protein H0H93_014505, partial [Arthromyces matolae]